MHKGIALGDGRVLHNTPFRGEHITSEADFRAGKRLRVTRLDDAERRRALRSAMSAGDRSYNLITNNCEHTVHRAARGRAESPQLRGWALGVGLAAAAFAVTRHPAVAAAGYALGHRLGSNWSGR